MVRACCNEPPQTLCPPGETSWFDDFSTYTDGQELDAFGYVEGSRVSFKANATNQTGSATEIDGIPVPRRIVTRYYPWHPAEKTTVKFELEFFFQQGLYEGSLSVFTPEPELTQLDDLTLGIYWLSTPGLPSVYQFDTITRNQNGTLNVIDREVQMSAGDKIQILVAKINFADPELHSNVKFYHNDVLVGEQESWNSTNDWCTVQHGFGFYRATQVDNWNFQTDGSITFGLSYPEFGTGPDDWNFTIGAVEAVLPITNFPIGTVYTIDSGTLPSGFSLNASTGEVSGTSDTISTGSVSIKGTPPTGSPITAGPYTWGVTAAGIGTAAIGSTFVVG